VAISQQVAATLNEIVTKARQVDELAAEVASASREQTQGITQINTAVGQMDKVTQSNAASAEESAAAAQELNAQAITMQQSVTELLQLVGSGGQVAAAPPAAAPHYQAAVQRTKPVAPKHNAGGIITWNEAKMATGVATVDEQHQELIERINTLHAACLAGTASEELMEQLNFLGNYAQSHFAHEETIMQEHRCPSRGQNKAAHTKFLRDYERVVAMVKENGASSRAAIELKRMLGDWLTSHICRIDTGLRNCPGAAAANGRAGGANGMAHRRNEIPLGDGFKDF
jgi:hemerythrin-like metal-binding protein